MLGANDLPFEVVGERCLIMEKAPMGVTEGGIIVPDVAKERYSSGKLLAAGLAARDKLYDAGIQFGDDVEFGRYAGLKEAWDRIVEGDHTKPDDAYDWKLMSSVTGVQRRYKCANTGAIRSIDSIIVLNVDDVIASVQLAERLRGGSVIVKRGVTEEKQTQHYIERVGQ